MIQIDDKRNPNNIRGDTESHASYSQRILAVIQRLEWQSDGHRMWYTHRNPYGCWICEIFQITRQLCGDEDLSEDIGQLEDAGTDLND